MSRLSKSPISSFLRADYIHSPPRNRTDRQTEVHSFRLVHAAAAVSEQDFFARSRRSLGVFTIRAMRERGGGRDSRRPGQWSWRFMGWNSFRSRGRSVGLGCEEGTKIRENRNCKSAKRDCQSHPILSPSCAPKSWRTLFGCCAHDDATWTRTCRPLVAVLDFSPKFKALSTQITLPPSLSLSLYIVVFGRERECAALIEWI